MIAYYFWVVVIFVFALSLINFLVLVAIAGAYNFTLNSIDNIEIVPEAQAVKFLRDAHLSEMYVRSGQIAGYKGKSEVADLWKFTFIFGGAEAGGNGA